MRILQMQEMESVRVYLDAIESDMEDCMIWLDHAQKFLTKLRLQIDQWEERDLMEQARAAATSSIGSTTSAQRSDAPTAAATSSSKRRSRALRRTGTGVAEDGSATGKTA